MNGIYATIAKPLQADNIVPDNYAPMLQSDHVVTTDAWGMPSDLPLPVAESNGVFVPATAENSDIKDYNPWQWAQVATMVDDSRPVAGPYGEPSLPGKSGSIIAEWGGMPYPVRDYQDQAASVAYSPRQVNYHQSHGPAGTFLGPQQTVYEAQAQLPPQDYWSTIILQG